MSIEDLLRVPEPQGLQVPQGKIASRILVTEDALSRDADLIGAVAQYVRTLLNAHLVPGEFPEEALWSGKLNYYVAQVMNGGHGQVAGNSGMAPDTLRGCRLALAAMSAPDHLAIFDEFLKVMASDAVRAERIAEQCGFGDEDPAIRELDRRFFALDAPTAQQAAWLRGLSCLHSLPRAEIDAAIRAIADANTLREARAAGVIRATEEAEAADPNMQAARAFCAQERSTFLRFGGGVPLPGGGVNLVATTSAGARFMRLVPGDRREWRTSEGLLRGVRFEPNGTPYPVGIGDGTARRAILQRPLAAEPAAPSATLAAFFAVPLEQISLALADRPYADAAMIRVAGHAASLPFLPRRISPLFALHEEHAAFRLLFASALWDLSTAETILTHGTKLPEDVALALLVAQGAIAAAAAVALRLLPGPLLTMLAQEAPADLARERLTVVQQSLELIAWSRACQHALALAAGQLPRQRFALFGRPVFQTAGQLLASTEMQVVGNPQAWLAYFDSEYAVAGLRTADGTADMTQAVAAMRHALSPRRLRQAVRWWRGSRDALQEPEDLVVRLHLLEAATCGVRSPSPLLPVLMMLDRKTLTPWRHIVLDFDPQGRRRGPLKR